MVIGTIVTRDSRTDRTEIQSRCAPASYKIFLQLFDNHFILKGYRRLKPDAWFQTSRRIPSLSQIIIIPPK